MTGKSETTKIAVMANDISYIKDKIDEITKNLDSQYAKKSEVDAVKQSFTDFREGEYKYVRALVFGFVSLILVAFAGVIIAFFIPRH